MELSLPSWEQLMRVGEGFNPVQSAAFLGLFNAQAWQFLRSHPLPGVQTDGADAENELASANSANAVEYARVQLRKQFSADSASAILNQWQLREKALEKFSGVQAKLFTRAGLEQATRSEVSEHRAKLFAVSGAKSIVDLGCGLGADSAAFAHQGLETQSVELDPDTAWAAAVNLFGQAQVFNADALSFNLPAEAAVFCDPARRIDGKRIMDPYKWIPSFSQVKAWAGERKYWGAKLAPGIAHELLESDWHVQWISVEGALVEAAAYAPLVAAMSPGRSAVLFKNGQKLVFEVEQLSAANQAQPEVEVRGLGQYVFEPDDALIRCGALLSLSQRLDAGLVSPSIAYLTFDNADSIKPAAQYGSVFEVQDCIPLRAKTIKAYLAKAGVSSVEIKKRGVDISPDSLRKQILPKKAAKNALADDLVLILTRVDTTHRCIVAKRL